MRLFEQEQEINSCPPLSSLTRTLLIHTWWLHLTMLTTDTHRAESARWKTSQPWIDVSLPLLKIWFSLRRGHFSLIVNTFFFINVAHISPFMWGLLRLKLSLILCQILPWNQFLVSVVLYVPHSHSLSCFCLPVLIYALSSVSAC